ncbi:unnamed protein product, partial [Choristocarpus tenellus]
LAGGYGRKNGTSTSYRKDFVLPPKGTGRLLPGKAYRTCGNTIHVDETWLYLIRDRQKVRMFPGEEKVALTKVQHKSHTPKVMFISTVSRPDLSRNFDSKVRI